MLVALLSLARQRPAPTRPPPVSRPGRSRRERPLESGLWCDHCRVIAKADIKLNAKGAAWGAVSAVRSHRGIGTARLSVDLDISPRIDEVVGGLISMICRVKIILPDLQEYLCDLWPLRQYIEVPERGGSITVTLEGAIGLRQLKIIEQHRVGDVTLSLDLTGHWVLENKHVPFWNTFVDTQIEHSAWVKLLSGWGYRNVLLLEFDQPTTARTKELEAAFTYLSEARDRFLEHDARHTVESLRQCLAALVGKQAEEEDSEEDVIAAQRGAKRDARPGSLSIVDYARRFELTRLALKFTSDLAAHPEGGETTLREAESLLIMTAGLIHQFAHPRDN